MFRLKFQQQKSIGFVVTKKRLRLVFLFDAAIAIAGAFVTAFILFLGIKQKYSFQSFIASDAREFNLRLEQNNISLPLPKLNNGTNFSFQSQTYLRRFYVSFEIGETDILDWLDSLPSNDAMLEITGPYYVDWPAPMADRIEEEVIHSGFHTRLKPGFFVVFDRHNSRCFVWLE